MVVIALVEVEHHDDAVSPGGLLEGLRRRPRDWLGQVERVRPGAVLGIERRKGQLRIDDEVGAGTRGFFERSQPSLHVTREVGGRLLLDQGDFHRSLES